MISFPIYMDNCATTKPDPLVVNAMLPYLYDYYGNASSLQHSFGWRAEEAVKISREQVAALIGAETQEVIFTSGATESINLAMKGCMDAYYKKGNHLVTVKTEHKAVLDTCSYLEKKGKSVTYLDVDKSGNIDLLDLENAITPETVMIAVMMANNETGTIQDIASIAAIAKRYQVIFFCDATQAVGKIPIDVKQLGIDLLCLSGHKLYGPKGVGALYIRRKNPRVTILEQINGGGQEKGIRGGTLNVPGIVSLGSACEIAKEVLINEYEKIEFLRNSLEQLLLSNISGTHINGNVKNRLPHISNLSFDELVSNQMLSVFSTSIAVSAGSACTSGSNNPSYVLMAMGLGLERSKSSIRFSLGRFNTLEEVKFVADFVKQTIIKLRA